MRKDGKTKFQLMLMALFFGIFGGEYFYVKRKKIAWTKLLISWLGATIIIAMLIIWATLNIEGKAQDLAIAAHVNKVVDAAKKALPEGTTAEQLKKVVEETTELATKSAEAISLGKQAFDSTAESMHLSVVIVCSLAATLPGLTLAWSLFNVIQIQSGSFVDEHNKEVSTWKATKEEFAKYLLGEE